MTVHTLQVYLSQPCPWVKGLASVLKNGIGTKKQRVNRSFTTDLPQAIPQISVKIQNLSAQSTRTYCLSNKPSEAENRNTVFSWNVCAHLSIPCAAKKKGVHLTQAASTCVWTLIKQECLEQMETGKRTCGLCIFVRFCSIWISWTT